MTIGARLKLVRNKAKLNLEKTAALFDITAQTLSRYENMRRTPDNEFLEAFGKHFNLSGDWLLYGEPPIFKAAEMDKDLKEVFVELSQLINSKKVPNIDIPDKLGAFMEKISEDTPENFLIMLEYMHKFASVRKNIFQFFYLFQKPMMDERIKFLEQGR